MGDKKEEEEEEEEKEKEKKVDKGVVKEDKEAGERCSKNPV